jgi:hypothetical protein
MSLTLKCGALLLGFNLLGGQIGSLSVPCRSYAAFLLWLPVLSSSIGPKFAAASRLRKGLALGLLVPCLLGFRAGGVHAVFGIFLSLLAPFILGGEKDGPDPAQALLLLTTALAGLWTILRQVFPVTFVWLESLSSLTCALSSLAARQAIELGPSYSGISIVLLFLIFHFGVFALSQPKKPRWLFALAGGQLLLLVAYQMVFHHLLLRWHLDSAWVLLGSAQLGLFVAGFVLLAIQVRSAALPVVSRLVPAGKVAGLAAASALLLLGFSDGFWALFQPRVQPKVLLYDDGTLDWSVPAYGRYSGMAGGMFGWLGPFLERHNCEAARGPLKDGALEKANVLVVFNLMHKFPAEEKRRIWNFVAAGGSLLAVGDHTGTTHIREPFNDLLAPVNIRFNFDCAMPVRMMWTRSLECFQHYTTAGLETEADTGICVGASLSIGWPALPLVVGTLAWSDKGDLNNQANGYLGDRSYSNDERLGDVVLVATANYERGKVLVFGDTTSFQNGALARSGDFVRAIVEWLPMKALEAVKMLLRLLLAAAVAVLWAWIGAKASWPVAWMSLFVCFYLGCAASAVADRECARPPAAASIGTEALIDNSHLSRCDQDLWQPNGVGGLVQNLMRKNYLPVVTSRFSPQLLRQSKLVFLVAPAKAFRASELSAYEAFVRDGGSLFVCVGYEEAAGCLDLLRRFGLRLRNLPLGPLGPETTDAKIYFLNAWPVVSDAGASEVLCKRGEYPLIVSRRYHRGKVILMGDSGFFLNRNLEMPESFNLNNIQFLQKLVPDHE